MFAFDDREADIDLQHPPGDDEETIVGLQRIDNNFKHSYNVTAKAPDYSRVRNNVIPPIGNNVYLHGESTVNMMLGKSLFADKFLRHFPATNK